MVSAFVVPTLRKSAKRGAASVVEMANGGQPLGQPPGEGIGP
jgi:hypothetical protein